jgi:hypothetical protein
LPGEESKE